MRCIDLGLLMLLCSSLAQAGNQWNVTLPGGGMRFQGIIIAEGCRIEAGDQQMTISLGRISSRQLLNTGEDTHPVPFDIHLQDCNSAVSRYVGIAFQGIADRKNPDVLSLADGPNVAKGVGIALFDKDDRLIPLNSAPNTWIPLHTGPTTLHLVAKYRATGKEITGGIANAQVWFSLTYP